MSPERVLAACSLGGAGHLGPLVAYLEAARARGDDRLVVGPPALAPLVAAVDQPFRAGGEPPESAVRPIRERLPTAPPGEAAVLANRELFAKLATEAMLPAMDRVFGDWAPTVCLRDPSEYASAVVAAQRSTPVAQVAISLAEVEDRSIVVAEPALEAHLPGLSELVRESPYLTRFPASVDPSPFPTTLRYRDPLVPSEPLPDWWAGAGGPLVYVTFGTVLGVMAFAGRVYSGVVGAMGDLAARVLVTVGYGFDPAALDPLPPNVRVESWVDQARVLAECDLVVCHGGSGTVLGALGAGVPMVIRPFFADQFENAWRLEERGAASVVGPGSTERTSAGDEWPTFAETVDAALFEPRLRDVARSLAAELASQPTAAEVLETLGPV